MKLRLEVLDRKGCGIVAAFVGAMSATLVGAINNANIQPGVGNCQYWNPFASRLIAQPGVPTYNSPELAAVTAEGRDFRLSEIGLEKIVHDAPASSLDFVISGHVHPALAFEHQPLPHQRGEIDRKHFRFEVGFFSMGLEYRDQFPLCLEGPDFEVVLSYMWRIARFLEDQPAEVQCPIRVERKHDRFCQVNQRSTEVTSADVRSGAGLKLLLVVLQLLVDHRLQQRLLALEVTVDRFL